nr:hypothetical protein [Ardenticatenales bacterium]
MTVILVFAYGLIVGARIDDGADGTGQLLVVPSVTPLETPLPPRPSNPTLTPNNGFGTTVPSGSEGGFVPTAVTPPVTSPTAPFIPA